MGPSAPVLAIGPSVIVTPQDRRCAPTSSGLISAMKQRSSDPGASTAPVSQFGAPVGRTLIFWFPNRNATLPSPNTSRSIPSTRTYQSLVASTSRQFNTTWSIRFTLKAIPHATVGDRGSSRVTARRRQHVVSLLLRRALLDHRARRQAR